MPSGAATTLDYGQFFGVPEFRAELSGFTLSVLDAMPVPIVDHAHAAAHLVLVLDGPYVTSADPLEPGRQPALVWNPPGTAHADRFAPGHGTFLALSVSDRRLDALDAGRMPARATGYSSGAALRLARRLARVCSAWPARRRVQVEALCCDLLGAVAHDAGPGRPRPPRWLVAARDALASRWDEAPTVAELARGAGVHPVHLIRSFRRWFGTTPGAFVDARRLDAGAALLAGSDRSVAEIALATGFADQSHFTRRFSRRFGIAPAAYRRRDRAN
jgi:AraC family transcriptional regulator